MVLKNRELEIRVKVGCVQWLSHDYHVTKLCSNQALEENVESLTEEWEKLEASECSLKEELSVSTMLCFLNFVLVFCFLLMCTRFWPWK